MVLILPMRNGNTRRIYKLQIIYSSYPTYEEWKQYTQSAITISVRRSYPTYEEWKPCYPIHFNACYFRSYPTYEEWKLLYIFIPVVCE